MAKNKTLADYITSGKHEFVAFVRSNQSLMPGNRGNYGTIGNELGLTSLGVLVCERQSENDETSRARFFYKSKHIYGGDSDIAFRDFYYKNAEVISELPLSISATTLNGNPLEKFSKEYREAKKLLKKYGLY